MSDENVMFLIEKQKKLKKLEEKLVATIDKIQSAINYLTIAEIEIQNRQLNLDLEPNEEDHEAKIKQEIEEAHQKTIQLNLQVPQKNQDEELESDEEMDVL